jgi:hypothetical protein
MAASALEHVVWANVHSWECAASDKEQGWLKGQGSMTHGHCDQYCFPISTYQKAQRSQEFQVSKDNI